MKPTIIYLGTIVFFQFSCKKEVLEYNTAIDTCVPDTVLWINDNDTVENYRIKMDCIIGAQLPEFNGITMDDKKIDMEYFRGKVSVINFWFEGCKPCEAEMPGLNKLV